MPKDTFYRIPYEKQQILLNTVISLFSTFNYEEVDVKRIVNSANIPRGSFYSYFNDLEDYYSYIIGQLQENRIKEIEQLAMNYQRDFFSFLIDMYEYDLKKITNPSRRLLQHHYYRYIQTIKKGSLSGTIYHLEKRKNVMSVFLNLPIMTHQGMLVSDEEKAFIADLCMTIYLSTYNQAIQENLSIDEQLNLVIKRLKLIERGVKSC